MKATITLFAVCVCLAACQSPSGVATSTDTGKKAVVVTKESLTTPEAKLNYTIGNDIGKNLKRTGISLNEDILIDALRAGFNDQPSLMTDEEMLEVKRNHAMQMQAKRNQEMEAAQQKNKGQGDLFLAENKAKEGVVVTESGLQYKILTPGKGVKPKATDQVSVNYRGTLVDGTEFDSSYKRNSPATFFVNQVIKGWTEALQLMPVGSKWQLVIPSDLAYGDRGAGPVIGPGSVLIFEVELLEIVAADKAKKQAD